MHKKGTDKKGDRLLFLEKICLSLYVDSSYRKSNLSPFFQLSTLLCPEQDEQSQLFSFVSSLIEKRVVMLGSAMVVP